MTIFAEQVLAWFDQHGRKDLPWQQDISAYRVWVSEIMLQQTQVKTVIPYYQRFIQRFATVESLANADLDEVLHHWSGLGYYSRAKNLHQTAQIVSQQYQGQFPQTVAELSQLPGIGRSTAGAIAAIAFKQHSSILDGNVKRVLARHQAIEGWTGQSAVLAQLWQIAEANTPAERTADYTQAMMDLGAMICTRSKPNCQQCPLQASCQAYAQQAVTRYPTPKPKKQLPVKQTIMLVIQHGDEILLEQRPLTGIWPGLYSFYEVEQESEISGLLYGKLACNNYQQTPLTAFRHTFSHYHLDINAIHIQLDKKPARLMADNSIVWYNMRQTNSIGLTAPVMRLLKLIHPTSE